MWDAIWNNRQWIFSGVGIAIIAGLWTLLRGRAGKIRQAQRSGDRSTNIQSGRDTTIR